MLDFTLPKEFTNLEAAVFLEGLPKTTMHHRVTADVGSGSVDLS